MGKPALLTRHPLKAAQLCLVLVLLSGLSACAQFTKENANRVDISIILGLFGFPRSPTAPKARLHRQLDRAQASVRPQGSVGNPPPQGFAPFFGNLSAVALPASAPAADFFGLQRQPDCSLTLLEFSATLNSNQTAVTVAPVSQTPHYEQVIHASVPLSTTADQFPVGCLETSLGSTSLPLAVLGPGNNGFQQLASPGTNGVLTSGVNTEGTFTVPVSQPTTEPPITVLGADLNGDGNPDLISVNSDGLHASVTVFLGKDDGTYQPGVNLPLPGASAAWAVLDDLNGDGKLDLLVSSDTPTFGFSIFLGKGDGTFNPPQTFAPSIPALSSGVAFITADVNGDTHKDIVTAQGQVFLGSGDGVTFTQVPQPAFPPIVSGTSGFVPSLVAADFNHDGKLDLATDDGSRIRISLGNGDGTFVAGASYATTSDWGFLIATDLDGDGNIDLWSGYGGKGFYAPDDDGLIAYALMGNGDGTFQGAPALPIAFTGTNLADLNGDGRPDLVGFSTDSQSDSIFDTLLPSSDGSFHTGPELLLPPSNGFPVGSSTFVLADFNGDHVPDLLFAAGNPNTPGFYLALGNGDGSFHTPTFIAAPTFEGPGDLDVNLVLADLVVADFNHDGKPDIAYNFTDTSFLTHNITEGLAVQLGNGDGTFQAPKFSLTYSSLTAPLAFFSGMIGGVGDVNNDGFPDVILVIPGAITNGTLHNSEELFISNGDGSFEAPVPVTLTGNMLPHNTSLDEGFPITFADLNGDGNIDLIVGGSSSDGTTPELAIALGNGNGTFQPPAILNLFGFGYVGAPVVADFTGDGKLDVYADGIFPGNGDGTLQSFDNGDSTVSPPLFLALSVFGASAAVDLNGDEKPDLIVGNVILLNETGNVVPPPATAPTTTALVSSLDPSTSGQSVTFTATVASTTAGTPSGTATFFDGVTALSAAIALNGQSVATFTTSALAAGPHSITAQSSGDTNFSSSVSNTVTQTVNAANKASSTTAIVSSLNPSTSGQSVTFTATVTSQTAGTPTGTATFFDAATALGAAVNLNGQAATFTTSSLSSGSHSITAQYSGDTTFATSTSTSVNQQVNAAATPDFSVMANPAALNLTAGQSGNIVFTVTPINGSTQMVTLSCGTLPQGVTCMFAPPSLTLDGTHSPTSTLTLQTTGPDRGMLLPTAPGRPLPILLLVIFALFAIAAFFALRLALASRGLRPVSPWLLVLVFVAFAVVACSSLPRRLTPSGSFPITITLSAAGTNHTVPITLNVSR